ncbi:Protein pygopus [Halotydeus destructor]|nr:Protein pygopus [Halotydeus destructor]
MEPPSRNTMWRFGFPTKANYEDSELFCGGIKVQWEDNGGRCGICGDPYNAERVHETGGFYARNITTRTYAPGSVIDVVIDLVANHGGKFVFEMCWRNKFEKKETESCFEPLLLADGRKDFDLDPNAKLGLKVIAVQLPRKKSCERCVLRWHWRSGNNWGECADGTTKVGCGPQETYRNCADIAVSNDGGIRGPLSLRMPREKKSKKNNQATDADGEPIQGTKSKKRRSSNVGNNQQSQQQNAGPNSGLPMGQNNIPPPVTPYGETIYAGNPFDDYTSSSQQLPPGTPMSQGGPMPGPGGQMPMGHMMPGGPQGGMMPNMSHMMPHPSQQQGKPGPIMSGKIYPPDQPRVYNSANPNAPPIYPCGICHKEVHDNDQAILCESGCNFWFHRVCTGLTEYAYLLLNEEIYAEWACDKCHQNKRIPLVKFKP